MSKKELLAICQFLLSFFENYNFKGFIKVTNYMYDVLAHLDDDILLKNDNWIVVYKDLFKIMKDYI